MIDGAVGRDEEKCCSDFGQTGFHRHLMVFFGPVGDTQSSTIAEGSTYRLPVWVALEKFDCFITRARNLQEPRIKINGHQIKKTNTKPNSLVVVIDGN